ncbi:MAG: LysE family transporter [Rhabdochlamydiaceae bacterium]|nr:LysE family transporter [Rhabdochlamydiaceae bacterium]
MPLWIKGLILGLCIAAPVGPIGILCIKRTLHSGRWAGVFSGLGAACADAIFGVIAAFSLTSLSSFLLHYQAYFKLAGGIFLLYLGLKTFFEKPTTEDAPKRAEYLASAFSSTFALTLTNPMTILSFMAIFAGIGLNIGSSNYTEASQLVIGVFFGSLAWWLFLAELVTLFRKRVNASLMRWINRLAGCLIFLFGLLALLLV